MESSQHVEVVGEKKAIAQQGTVRDVETQAEVLAAAQEATDQEHSLTFWRAVKTYPKAVGWSVLLSTALVMEGYDNLLIASLYAQPAFRKKYGQCVGDTCQITAPWQAGLKNGASVGQIFGLLGAGYLTERFGFRKSMIGGLVALTGFIFIQFFSPKIWVLEIGQILTGIPLGIFQAVTTVYAVEVAPTCLRAHLTSYVNLCWVFGQTIGSGVLRGTLHRQDQWAYRIPFALQWMWPVPLIIGIYLAPESPWWLARRSRIQEAKASLRRLASRVKTDSDLDRSVALMAITIEHEREIDANTSYLACFKGINLRRTIIVIGAYCIQTLSGSGMRTYSTYFFEEAGLPVAQAFNMSIVSYAIGIVGVILAWFMLPRIGRRTLYIWGLICIIVAYVIIGGLGIAQRKSSTSTASNLAWGVGALLLFSVFVYDTTLGPVAYSLVSEIPSTLLRSKSVAIARMCYNIVNIAANTITPYQLNPSAWGWGALSAFFWAGSAILSLLFTYYCIPEPKDRTLAELDLLFERRTSARRFVGADVRLAEEIRDKSLEA